MATHDQWLMFFYTINIDVCHFDLTHSPLFLWEFIGQKPEAMYDFNCHVHLLSTPSWASLMLLLS